MKQNNVLWHISNGKVFAAPSDKSYKEYVEYVRNAYGSLRGIKFVYAPNRALAQWKAANGQTA